MDDCRIELYLGRTRFYLSKLQGHGASMERQNLWKQRLAAKTIVLHVFLPAEEYRGSYFEMEFAHATFLILAEQQVIPPRAVAISYRSQQLANPTPCHTYLAH